MTEPSYTSSELYRRLHIGDPDDIESYLRIAEGAHRILDLGCGWGRITIPLALAGHRVVGIDVEQEFLLECRQRLDARGASPRVELLHRDATCLNSDELLLKEQFQLIIIPYNTVYALGGSARFVECLEVLRQCLTPDGNLWFDVYDLDEFHGSFDAEQPYEDDGAPVASWEDAGSRVEVFETTQVLPERQRLIVDYDAYAAPDFHRVGHLNISHDYLLTQDIEKALDQAKFDLIGKHPRSALHSYQPNRTDEDTQMFYRAAPR